MPAKDIFHENVKRALIKEEWIITHDPYWIKLADSDINVFMDLAAEKIIAAEKEGQKIAVEIKSFTGTSLLVNFHEAIGQYLDYRIVLNERDSERRIYLAIPIDIYNSFFRKRFIQLVCQEYNIKLIIFDPEREEIVLWKK